MIADVIGRFAVRHLPSDFALVHIVRRDPAVGRFQQRQATNGESGAALSSFSRGARSARCGRRAHGRARPRIFARGALHIFHIGKLRAGTWDHSQKRDGGLRVNVEFVRLGIVGAAGPIRAAGGAGRTDRGQRSLGLAHRGRSEERTDAIFRNELRGLGAKLGGEVNQIVDGNSLIIECRRLRGKWLLLRIPLAGDIAFGHGALVDGPDRLTIFAIEDVKEALLGGLRDRFYGAPADGDIRQDRRAGNVHVPYAVVNQLVVPLALAGLQVNGDDALTEEAAARAIAAVVIAGGQFHGQIDKAELFVNGDLRPYTGIAGVGEGVLPPGVGSILTGLGNRVKDPKALAGAHIKAAHVAAHVFAALGIAACEVCGADDDDILRDYRRGMQAHFARYEVDILIVVLFQIDDAIAAEAGNRRARLGVQRDQPVAGRDVKDALFLAVGPIGDAMPGKLPGRVGAAHAFVFAMDPEKFASSSIERHDGAARAAGGVEHAVN